MLVKADNHDKATGKYHKNYKEREVYDQFGTILAKGLTMTVFEREVDSYHYFDESLDVNDVQITEEE